MSAGSAQIGKPAPDFACQALVDGEFKTVKLRYEILKNVCKISTPPKRIRIPGIGTPAFGFFQRTPFFRHSLISWRRLSCLNLFI